MTTEHHPAHHESPTLEGQDNPEAKALQGSDELQAHVCLMPTASGATPPETPPDTPGASGEAVLLLVILLMLVMPVLMLLPGLENWGRNSVITPQGTVQRITFVKGWGVSSQIDTEQRSFLVRGATQLRKGARLETRSGPLGSRLCDAERLTCDELVRDE